MSGAPACRVCQSPSTFFFKDTRTFYKCPACQLIFTGEMADAAAQESHYKGQWDNQADGFWRQQADSLLAIAGNYLTPQKILDFGAGSGALAAELSKRGRDVTPLEPMVHGYLKDQRYPEPFDLIVAVEVIEHLPNLWEELAALKAALKDGGIILFTTFLTNRFIESPDAAMHFAGWWYKDDPTHVSFFGNRSLAAIGAIGGWKVDVYGDQAAVFRKAEKTG